jgi:cAMP-binding proteins - catabolite gene activator and regulatory subunit of cAMP-dependent protein kinases
MNDDVLITKVKQICNKKPKERSHSDLLELEDLTKNTKVFKNLIETNGDYAHRLCCQHLVYEYCAENNYLFKQGDPGTRFYIIISGNVGVEIPMKDEHSGEIKTIEVVSFTKGACFGELALESSKPRAASIKCKSDSHFVALEKVDYNRMIAKMVRDKRDFIVNFFSSLPIFSNMTKGSLAKLTYNFREKDYIKNQVVYKEGDFAVDAFIIVEGEFLFTKK